MRIVVVGLGSVGSQALWRLAGVPGVEAIGVEQFGVGHAHGSFTGESRLFRAAYHEGAAYAPLLRRARAGWHELERATGRTLLLETGFLTIGDAGSPSFERSVASVVAGEVPHERLDADELRARFPQFAARDGDSGLLDGLGGVLRPELGVLSAVDEARRLGAVVHESERVLGVEPTAAGVVVTTARRRIEADRAVVTAGSWSGTLDARISRLVEARRIPLMWFAPESDVDLATFGPDRFPAFFADRPEGGVYGAATLDGASVKASPHGDVPPIGVDRPEDLDRRLDPAETSAFGARVHEILPGLRAEPVRWSVHHDGYTADGTPIVDRPDGGPVVVVAGLSGHGFKLAPALGEVAAQLATNDAAPLHHERFTLAAHRVGGTLPAN